MRARLWTWAFVAALAASSSCAGLTSDQEALEKELERARSGVGIGRAQEEYSSARATGTQRIETILEPTPLRGAGGLACHDGQIFVAEPVVNRISAVQADGTVRRIGTPHGFWRPTDLAFDERGVLYAATAEPGGVWRRAPSGAWDRLGPDLLDLEGVTVGPGGDLLVAECARGGRILRLSPTTGEILEAVATELGCPGRLAALEDGTILVPRRDHGEVVAVNPGSRSTSLLVQGLELPTAVGVTPDGERVVLDAGTGRVRVLPGGPAGTAGASPLRLSPGIADAVTCGETVVVSNEATGALRAYKPWPTGGRVLLPPGLVVPSGLYFEGADLIVADRASVKRIRGETIETLVIARPGVLPPPVGITGGLPGLAWITAPAEGELLQVDLGRGEATRIASGLDWPTSVLRTFSGEIVVAETGAGRVVKLGAGAVPYTMASGLMSPVALATRGERILTAEPAGGRVLRIRPGEAPTVLVGGLGSPSGLATARGRPLYIALARKGAVAVRSRDGSVRRVLEGLALTPPRGEKPLPVPIAIDDDGSIVVGSPQDGSIVRLWPY